MHAPIINLKKQCVFWVVVLFCQLTTLAQLPPMEISQGWTIENASPFHWHSLQSPGAVKASVPGSVYMSLLDNHLIDHPFYADHHLQMGWVDSLDWLYQTTFTVEGYMIEQANVDLVFEGIDTYADIFINGQKIGSTDNMFRQWQFPIKPYIHPGSNQLEVLIHAAMPYADSLAQSYLPLRYPDNNRVFTRKAQYQFGWDWGPVLIGAGIWKKVWLDAYNETSNVFKQQKEKDERYNKLSKDMRLIQQKDSFGTSFYFEQSGKPVYMKGANWIPGTVFPGTMKHDDYRRWLLNAKEANMNMLRVWGGGYYEEDAFYDLCDSLGIYVWQDFMFACGMYPGDNGFIQNVKKEVTYQIKRLRHHPCIVLWCGNNESEEGWKNWGWQQQFTLHGDDSIQVWRDYQRLFQDSLSQWVKELDGSRPYVSTSPKNGWGHPESFTEGDSHYWGLWWGLQDWEVFKDKTGRFVSEYGMQSMSHYATIQAYTPKKEMSMYSPTMKAHQRAGDGFKKLNHYLLRYFIDSLTLKKLSVKDYAYLTQCMQAHILYNSIITHRSQPKNMGTLLWQLNDCWPVTSWSIVDYFEQPKAAWYAVKRAYEENTNLSLDGFNKEQCISSGKPRYSMKIIGINTLTISADRDAYFVNISHENGYPPAVSDNYFHLKKGEVKVIEFKQHHLNEALLNKLNIGSLNELYLKYKVK